MNLNMHAQNTFEFSEGWETTIYLCDLTYLRWEMLIHLFCYGMLIDKVFVNVLD